MFMRISVREELGSGLGNIITRVYHVVVVEVETYQLISSSEMHRIGPHVSLLWEKVILLSGARYSCASPTLYLLYTDRYKTSFFVSDFSLFILSASVYHFHVLLHFFCFSIMFSVFYVFLEATSKSCFVGNKQSSNTCL